MNLRVFLSNRCNMACDYCFVDLNSGKARILDRAGLRRACSEHLDRGGPKDARFTMLGGEPLLHFPLLIDGLRHIRRAAAGARARISVLTNGVLLTKDKVARLTDLGAEIVISLDGRAADNDRHRPLVGRPKASSSAAILRNVPAAARSAFGINMVVCRDTLPFLQSNVEFLRQTGFQRLVFNLNANEAWPDDDLAALRKTMQGFVRYYRVIQEKSPKSLAIAHLSGFFPTPCVRHEYQDVTLGADGHYYVCGGVIGRPYDEISDYRVGSIAAGLDRARRRELLDRAQDFIHRHVDTAQHYQCPRHAYFYALAHGQDPVRLVTRANRAANVLGDALNGLANEARERGGRP